MSTLLIILLILMLVGAFPAWPHSASWGYSPSVIILIVLIILLVTGKL